MRYVAVLAFMAVVIILSLGCLSPPEKGASTVGKVLKSTEKAHENLTLLRIGYQITTHHVAEMVAMEKGWWQDDLEPLGVKEVREFGYPSGAPQIEAMKAGDLDVIYICTSPVIAPISRDLDARIVAGVNLNGSTLVFQSWLDYKGPGSLRGLRVATYPPGTAQDVLIKKWLIRNGIDLADVNITKMGPGDAVNAMLTGKVDAVFLPEPAPAAIEAEKKGKAVLMSGEMWPNHACCGVVMSGKLIKEHPDVAKQVIKTHIKATDYINAHPAEAARIYSNHTGQNLSMVEHSLKSWDGRWISDPHMLVNDTLEFAEFQYHLNYTQKEMGAEDLFETGIYDQIKGS